MRKSQWRATGAALFLLGSAGCVTAHADERDQRSLSVRTSDQGELPLELTDATVVVQDGRPASIADLKPGEEVRATYQIIEGRARAMRIDATAKDLEPRQDPTMMQIVPGDQAGPDDRLPPVRSEPNDFELLQDTH